MSENGIDFTTPTGRIVWGNPAKPQQKKYQDGPQKGQVVMKDGQPVLVWSFGLAIPRAEFEQQVWPLLAQEAQTGYPNQVPGRFAWKFKDGDRDVDQKGVPYSTREGYAGHYVLQISTEFQAPPIFKFEHTTNGYRQLSGEEIKTGDFARVGINAKVNVPPAGSTNTPSMYVNPRGVEHVGYGTAIVGQGAADPTQMFGAAPVALPPGASAVPVGAPAGAAAMPGMAPGALPVPAALPGPAMAPPAPIAPPPAPIPVGPQRPVDPSHIHAAGTAQEQWWINGAWTPAVAAPLPPPAPDFVAAATGLPAAPAPLAMPGGAPGLMPPR